MDYEAFLTAILSRISIHLDILRDEHTRGICMRHIGVLLDEGRLGEAFLLCPQCQTTHLSPVELHACIDTARSLDAVLTTLNASPCPQARATPGD